MITWHDYWNSTWVLYVYILGALYEPCFIDRLMNFKIFSKIRFPFTNSGSKNSAFSWKYDAIGSVSNKIQFHPKPPRIIAILLLLLLYIFWKEVKVDTNNIHSNTMGYGYLSILSLLNCLKIRIEKSRARNATIIFFRASAWSSPASSHLKKTQLMSIDTNFRT